MAKARRKIEEHQYRELFESNPAPMWVFDLKTRRIRAVNDAAVSQYGCGQDEFLALTLDDLRSGENEQELLKASIPANSTAEFSGEFEHRRKDGSRIFVEIYSSPIVWEGVAARIATVIDITERKKLETHVLRAHRLESIGALAGGVAHDLNNVLAPIIMCAEMLRDNQPQTDPVALISLIEDSARRGAGIVKQVLTFARGVEGQLSHSGNG